ncbi:MAG: aerobic carbon-monoxide dehydrogenase small subunit [Pseudonocardiales bacterium]|jgi:aerobic-type carbon monoxide dehydrogenase small subunit (CoxS/CutS family)|uniref:(2Fe-2S)-binding protein n=1 Tax=Pseudonocardia sp. TaxID=60912 RepID=UPI002620E462|nr:(2Fe-2S)-binding protein [Pseudonocardia sp.]MCW2716777.1 putative carbon monoxide dehydrogenase [Pseudonocardia sp.]MDT7618247.1 aerobic carbon-monoxide dehydrogenase small subunit [Pseudonocardiales bacterium]MDT7708629.1 aerobic carbon-monoxide dehydrogenase small subunit [Pseudonocardiales bacterium]
MSTSDPERETVPSRHLDLTVNGRRERIEVEDRAVLADVLRDQLHLTGTHIGCRNGDCGACTVEIDGRIQKSCIVLAATVDGCAVTTVEGLADPDEPLPALQQALWEADAFQCGFCLPGHLFSLRVLLDETPDPTEEEVREALVGNLCRCTGYVNIVKGALAAAARQTAVPQ